MADASLIIGPSIALGAIIGFYEAVIMHRDVSIPTHRFGHMFHAFLLSIVFVFAVMNVEWVFSVIPGLADLPVIGIPLLFQIAIGLIAAIKIHAVSRVIKSNVGGLGSGLGETWFHSLLVGGLIIAAPYVYPYVQSMLPAWLDF